MGKYLLKIDDGEEQEVASIEKANSIFYGDKKTIEYETKFKDGSHEKVKKGIKGILVSAKDLRKKFGDNAESLITEYMRKHTDKLAVLTSDTRIVPYQDYDYIVDDKTHISRAFVPTAQALEKKRKNQEEQKPKGKEKKKKRK